MPATDLFSQAPDPADADFTTPTADESEETGGEHFDDGDRLYLCDAFALAYRAHFAFISRPLLDGDGNETSAAYGFTTSLLKLLEDEKPEHIAVVFDALTGPKTYRDELYDQYKAHRPKMPQGLRYCIPFIKRIVQAFDIPVVEIEGVEADDVIGTLAVEAAAEGADVRIVSPDKDFRQLLRPGVSMMRPAYKGEEFDMETADTFRETYGCEPPQFIDILALLGDASDNVPGVRGIGKKTAPKLVAEYGTVENLLDHAEDIKGKRVREGLLNHREEALMSKKLVTILTDVDHGVDPDHLRRTDPDLEALNEIFDELGFGKRLRTRAKNYAEGRERPRHSGGATFSTHLPEDDPDLQFDFGPYEPVKAIDEDAVDYETVYQKGDLPKLTAAIAHRERFAFDTETTSTDPMAASLVGLSAAHRPKKAVYAPTPLPDGTPEQEVLAAAREALLSEKALKVGHNVKYDLVVLKRHGVDVAGPFFDTMVAHYLIEPEASHKLDDVVSFYLNYRPQPITDLIGTGAAAISMRDVPVEDVGPYACEDADVTLRLVDLLKEKLEADGLLEIAETIEFPLVPVLAKMEMAGVRIDEAMLAEISKGLTEDLQKLEDEIFERAGRPFTIGSPKQLGEILFNPPPTDEERKAAEVWLEEMKDPKAAGKTKKQLKEETPTYGIGLEAKAKTASGKPSTNEAVLNELAGEHDLPMMVLDWRKIQKLQSTYVDRLPELAHPETGRVHTDFNQTVTATGRLSSSNPNLQNIPIRTERGREIRKAFIAEDGHSLLAADYAQIELRIIAHMSGDEGLKSAFQEGLDIHSATAAHVFEKSIAEITRTERNMVKQVNYGIPYGISAFGLAQRMNISNKEAGALIDRYRASYPDVIEYLDGLVDLARDKGYAETLLGRRRYLPQITSRNPRDRAFAERVALNMPIQGTQADMIKLAMVGVDRRLATEGLAARMILQVHDELVFEVADGEVGALTALVQEEMSGAYPLDVPIVVDVGVGPNWLDAH